ncbi:uncharacterized protein involved in type VI secretion and phage assembly [Arthrobacter ginsengisoli]|uniref:Uncharacterized protein involved in type VI secretion and phage assembly n=1 Tax=Arthrobacter ginsengisoli TaxID=1356565 RepID=A0ABU1U778_9MICC|nr:phage baseplate assembly protein V [Arthrobacter ginsengisoli]MDR7081026.1 uncharacterized protein involved in type VI secretion and phage assembly [Arthrobacter ginsengisoli]
MHLPSYSDGGAPGYFGVYPAIVTDIVDSDNLGRVEVRFPWLGQSGDQDVRAFATLCSPYADKDQGLQILPEVDSQVVVAFEAGDLRRPYVLGSAWHGAARLPHQPERSNNIRQLRSRADSRLEFNDGAGAEKVSITMRSGHEIIMDSGRQEITIRHAGGSVIRFNAAGGIEIQANVSVDVTSPMVKVTSPMSTFTGVVKCTTLIAEASVISPAYTPGVGNLW